MILSDCTGMVQTTTYIEYARDKLGFIQKNFDNDTEILKILSNLCSVSTLYLKRPK